MNPTSSNDGLAAGSKSNNVVYAEEMISAITLDPFLDDEELDFSNKTLQPPTRRRSRMKKRVSDPRGLLAAREPMGKLLDKPDNEKRFSRGSESSPCIMPKRKLSTDDDDGLEDEDLDYKATQHSTYQSNFLLEEEDPYDGLRDDTEPTYSLDSFEIGETREKQEEASEKEEETLSNSFTRIKIGDIMRKPRHKSRTRRSVGSDGSGFTWNRAASSQSFDLSDVSEEQDNP